MWLGVMMKLKCIRIHSTFGTVLSWDGLTNGWTTIGLTVKVSNSLSLLFNYNLYQASHVDIKKFWWIFWSSWMILQSTLWRYQENGIKKQIDLHTKPLVISNTHFTLHHFKSKTYRTFIICRIDLYWLFTE